MAAHISCEQMNLRLAEADHIFGPALQEARAPQTPTFRTVPPVDNRSGMDAAEFGQ